jgi:MFS family permease
VLFTVFASLQYLGTLLSPLFGVAGDRLGQRNVLCAMRGLYTLLALAVMTLIAARVLSPLWVMALATITGLVRPSDIGLRYALIGDTMPAGHLMGATGIQRITQDSARVAGALSGAGLVAALGMGWAYAAIAALYATSFFLTLNAGQAGAPPRAAAGADWRSPWQDLKAGAAYVRHTPALLALMVLAFLLNATAFPQFNSLLAVVAKEVHGGDQTLLGALLASGALGGMLGSIVVSRVGGAFPAGRMMLLGCAAWYAALFAFAHIAHPVQGMAVLFLGGIAQAAALIPMTTLLMRDTEARFRGRVMGIRMLAIYGNLPGLLAAGPLIAAFGYPATATLYCTAGLVLALAIAAAWRRDLWRLGAPANRR